MRLKSTLLIPALTALSAVSIFSVVQLAGGGGLQWLGVALAAAPLPAAVMYWMATQQVARTSANLLPGWIAGGAGLSLVLFAGGMPLPVLLAAGSLLAFAWYVFHYSRFGRQPSETLILGEKMPEVTLFETDGSEVTTAHFEGHPSLYIFFRGNWCPLCMAQINEVAEQYRRISQMGVEVILVSGQTEEQTERLAARFDVPFRFLIDHELRAARHLGIFAENGTPKGLDVIGYDRDTMLPTVVATDAAGRITFLDQTDNYRVRPEPETFLKIFTGQPLEEVAA
ncbi:MAG: redoxin family protein [Pseudomonadota bacterium]